MNFKDSEEGFKKNWKSNYNLTGWLISLKKSGKMIPEFGAIKISLLGNDKEIFNTISVANISGFDRSEFNSISQSKFTHFLKKNQHS